MKIFKSRTVWTIIILFIVNGIQGIHSYIPTDIMPIVNALLGLAAIYFRVKPKVDFK